MRIENKVKVAATPSAQERGYTIAQAAAIGTALKQCCPENGADLISLEAVTAAARAVNRAAMIEAGHVHQYCLDNGWTVRP